MTRPVMQQRQPDDEWRNDRLERRDLWLILDRDVDAARVALAIYERQQARHPKPERAERGER